MENGHLSEGSGMARNNSATLQELLKSLPVVFDELEKSNDRGVVLSASQYVDEHLRQLLLGYFVDDSKVTERLMDFDNAIGTFSARINVAYACGLLRPDMYADLHTIREIRNQFAHSYLPIDFSKQTVRDRSLTLRQVVRSKVTPCTIFLPQMSETRKQHVLNDPRERFILTCMYLISELICVTLTTFHLPISTREVPER
jgi:DNA-binding MltR family transcriptional regulator